jgi:ribosomal protein L6P/L9E
MENDIRKRKRKSLIDNDISSVKDGWKSRLAIVNGAFGY